MKRLDCSMIRHMRVPHEQFVAIKNKGEYLIVEDRDNGEIVSFKRMEEISEEESEKMLEDMKTDLKNLKEVFCKNIIELKEIRTLTEKDISDLKSAINKGVVL